MGHVKPRIAIKSIEINEVPLGATFVGHCPGQGYPVPVYRYIFEKKNFKGTSSCRYLIHFCKNIPSS